MPKTIKNLLKKLKNNSFDDCLKMMAKDHKTTKKQIHNIIKDFLELREIEEEEEEEEYKWRRDIN